jgi:hypothetical protein
MQAFWALDVTLTQGQSQSYSTLWRPDVFNFWEPVCFTPSFSAQALRHLYVRPPWCAEAPLYFK